METSMDFEMAVRRMMWREESQKELVHVWDDGCENKLPSTLEIEPTSYSHTKQQQEKQLTSAVGDIEGSFDGLKEGETKTGKFST